MSKRPVLCILSLSALITSGVAAEVPPEHWDATVVVDASAPAGGDGSAEKPFSALAPALVRAREQLRSGRSVRVAMKPGTYREDAGSLLGPEKPELDRPLADGWFALEGEPTPGREVILSGADDWSVQPGSGDWQPVAGQSGLWRRNWSANWGPWGGWRGCSNIALLPGQRREMIFVQLPGKAWQRLEPVVLEDYRYSTITDDGSGATWWGAGSWDYQGFTGLERLTPMSFGVCELGPTAADAPANDPGQQRQDGRIYTKHGKPESRVSFKALFDAKPHAHPDSLFLRLPPGVDISQVKIEVAMRPTILAIGRKRNVIVRNLVFERCNTPAYAAPIAPFAANAPIYEWHLLNQGWRIAGCTFRDNNDSGLSLAGHIGSRVEDCLVSANGNSGINSFYCVDTAFTKVRYSGTGWRSLALGGGGGFTTAAHKTWRVLRCSWTDCTFSGNLEKGFYSDSFNGDGSFTRCAFADNGMGLMFEIPHGPIAVTDCSFTGNQVAAELVTADRVAITTSTFSGNRTTALAIDPRGRRSGDTLRPLRTDPVYGSTTWGLTDKDGGMLQECELPGRSLEVRGCRMASNEGPASALVRVLHTWAQPKEWEATVFGATVWAGNSFAHAGGMLPFQGPAGTLDGPGFLDATGFIAACTRGNGASTGNTFEPLPAAIRAARPGYMPGFIWHRARDWAAAEVLARTRRMEVGIGNGGSLGWDGLGNPTWLIRVTNGWPEGRGLAAGATNWLASTDLDVLRLVPWREGQRDRLIYRVFTEAGYATPTTVRSEGWLSYQRGESLVEWSNPTGRAATVAIAGTLGLEWLMPADVTAVEWGVTVIAADGVATLVDSGVAPRTTASVAVKVPAITVPAGGSLRWGVHYPGPHGIEHGVSWRDDLTITLGALSH